MVKLLAGLSGTGKTKRMLDEMNEAAEKEHGSLVCIELKTSLRYDLNYKVRLIEYQAYGLEGAESLKAFISGLHAGNFDITHVYLKSLHSPWRWPPSATGAGASATTTASTSP